jgi:tetratricopeptide (TPR) repeat protein
MQKYVLIALAAIATLSVAVLGTITPTAAYAETFSKAVGEPLKAAKTAIDKRQWDLALTNIKKAQGVASKTPYEEYQINEMLGYVLLQQKDYSGAAKVFEQNLNSGRMSPDAASARTKQIAQMYTGARNWPKAVEYGNKVIKAYPNDPEAHFQLAQAQSQNKDCKGSAKTMQSGIEAARRNGKTPEENWLNLKLHCQNELHDQEGMAATREQLVRYYPNRENWKAVLTTVYNQANNDDRATLNLYRLMLELDVLEKPNDYVEMAQMAIETGAPAEAVTVMERGFQKKVLENKDKERHTRLLNQAKTQAQTAQASLPTLEQQAKSATTGDADVQLGRAYLASGKYDKAVEAIQRGLKKGGVKGSDEAQMMLGRAYLKLKQKDQARRAFGAVPDDSKLAQVASLWGVYAQQA